MEEEQIAKLIADGSIGKAVVELYESAYYVRFYWSFIPDSFVILITDIGNMRFFSTLDSVASFITGIGISKFDVIT